MAKYKVDCDDYTPVKSDKPLNKAGVLNVLKNSKMKKPIVTFSKGEESKKRVLNAALALFSEQGYEKTTMRQIISKSGVLNGSVYYAFKNKEGIYEYVFDLILDRMYTDLDTDGMDLLSVYLMPLAVEMSAVNENKMIAEMIFHAHRSWPISQNMIYRYYDYLCQHYDKMGWPADKERLSRICTVIGGIVRTFCEESFSIGGKEDMKEDLRCIADCVCALMRLPLADVDSVIAKVLSQVDSRKKILEGLSF